jgi:RNA polymerase II-associated factor 1
MIVDADMGMPIDLSRYPRLWDLGDEVEDYGTCLYIYALGTALQLQSAISPDLNPDPNNLPELDPKDAFLVSDLASAYGPSASQVSTAASGPSMNVPWLRKTEYLSSSSTANIPALREM